MIIARLQAGLGATTDRQDIAAMTATPPESFTPGEDRFLELEAIDRDLELLGELTQAYVTDTTEDLSLAVARIPSEELRREATELLSHLRDVIESRFGELGAELA
jgi:hypothetical protein